MSKFSSIFKHEYREVVKKKSFIVGIVLTPLLMAVFVLLPAFLATRGSSTSERVAILDHSGIQVGERLARELEAYTLDEDSTPAFQITEVRKITPPDEQRFQDVRDSLVEVVAAKDVKYAIMIDQDPHLADTNMALVTNSDNFQSIRKFERELTNILSSIRLIESQVNLPVDSVLALTRRTDLPQLDTKGESISYLVKFFVAFGFIMIIYMMVFGYGSTLMRSVIEEKSSRIMEVLVSSVSPFQLLMGKVTGLGAAAFTQLGIWIIFGLCLHLLSGTIAMEIDSGVARIVFDPMIVAFFVLFFTGGYFLFSVFFALIGSLVNSDKEAQNFIFPVVMLLVVPMLVASSVAQDPNQGWVVVMSMLPPFAPTMMVMRILIVAPTETSFSLFSGILGEAVLSFLILMAFAFFTLWVTARIFRIGILMYGKRPTFPEIINWVRQS